MEYLNLSKEKTSNFMLSRIGLGSMRMGDVSEGINTIHTALDGGVNFLNTADFYGNGQSEMLIKEALKTRKREDVLEPCRVWMAECTEWMPARKLWKTTCVIH